MLFLDSIRDMLFMSLILYRYQQNISAFNSMAHFIVFQTLTPISGTLAPRTLTTRVTGGGSMAPRCQT